MVKFVAFSLVLVFAKSVASAKKLAPIFQPSNKLHQTSRRMEENEEANISFLSGYNVLYQNCFIESRTISFKLCPSDDDHRECDQEDCEDGGEYVVDMEDFLDAFTEMQMDAQEYRCEMARENCEDVNDDAVADCYIERGYDDYESYVNDCEDQDNDAEEEFNLQEYLACKEFDEDYFVGPVCVDSINIYLGLFTDEDCLYNADVTPEDLGYDMPFSVASGTSIIDDECGSCGEHKQEDDQNGGDDNEDEDDVIEQCEQLYENSQRCETGNMAVDDHEADDSACEYISELKANEANFLERGGERKRKTNWNTMVAIIGGVAAVLVIIGGVFFLTKKKSSDDKKENLIEDS